MNIKAVPLNDLLNRQFTDRGVAAQCLTYAVGVFVGKILPVPSGEVESEVIQYRNTCETIVRDKVSYINEMSVMDVHKAADVAKAIWMGRYHAVNPEAPHQNGVGGFIESHFHFNKFLSPEDLAFLNEHQPQIDNLIVTVRDLIKEQH